MKSKNKTVISTIIASVVSLLFLWATVISPPSAFNLLPYGIHEVLSPGGAGETQFIRGFDIAFAILLFFVCFKIGNRLITKKDA